MDSSTHFTMTKHRTYTTKQLAIYSTFEHNKISEHYLGIISINQLVASHLSAQNVLKAITKYLSDLGIELVNGRFFCMDTTDVNSGEKKWNETPAATCCPS